MGFMWYHFGKRLLILGGSDPVNILFLQTIFSKIWVRKALDHIF